MSNVTRYDPFQDFGRLEPFREEAFFPSLRKFFRDLPTEPTIKLEVAEDDRAYKVKAELPGVKKDDIAVEVDGNQVSISAEVKREKEEKKGEKIVHSERYYGRQSRTFTLAHEIKRDDVQAKFADGVLELTLPKNGGEPAKRISIQ